MLLYGGVIMLFAKRHTIVQIYKLGYAIVNEF